MNRRVITYAVSALLVLVVAFGIWKGLKRSPVATPADVQTAGYEPEAYLPPPATPEDEKTRNLRELRESIAAFQEAKTFRAKIDVDTEDGRTTGQIDVMKPDRFHGTVDVAKENQTGEVIGVGSAMYIKQPDGSWLMVQSPKVAAALTSAFRNTVTSNSELIAKNLPDGSDVTKATNASRKCDEYRTTVKGVDGAETDLTVCVADGKPKFIDATADRGTVSIEYFDYNTLFVIERPTVKRI